MPGSTRLRKITDYFFKKDAPSENNDRNQRRKSWSRRDSGLGTPCSRSSISPRSSDSFSSYYICSSSLPPSSPSSLEFSMTERPEYQQRSVTSCSMLRPPPKLHQRRFLCSEETKSAPIRLRVADPDDDWHVDLFHVSRRHTQKTLSKQEPSPDDQYEDRKDRHKHLTFGPSIEPTLPKSRWSDSTMEISFVADDNEVSIPSEAPPVKDNSLHSFNVELHRFHLHTWTLKPSHSGRSFSLGSELVSDRLRESDGSSGYRKDAKRWGVIF